MPLAGGIARASSGLLFSEPPKLVSDGTPTQARLDDLMKSGLQPTLLEGGELCAALGGAYLRVVWDEEVSDRPWIDTVAADRAVPEFWYGRLLAVTFWTVVESDDSRRVLRHLEALVMPGVSAGRRWPSQSAPARPPRTRPCCASARMSSSRGRSRTAG
ncbi:hypothetical protein GCM10012286_63290 [Streptomyces lasiicapitis]|uniref:Uncharacterized protein n=1 Tax=Streptomyces lasiicapitis TaxID=1923961 RepID=A0ABQ2MLV8_9ACTN|nr:hypothetical protein GCM10012286_63290 [Streptomyces lasiicapitis]